MSVPSIGQELAELRAKCVDVEKELVALRGAGESLKLENTTLKTQVAEMEKAKTELEKSKTEMEAAHKVAVEKLNADLAKEQGEKKALEGKLAMHPEFIDVQAGRNKPVADGATAEVAIKSDEDVVKENAALSGAAKIEHYRANSAAIDRWYDAQFKKNKK